MNKNSLLWLFLGFIIGILLGVVAFLCQRSHFLGVLSDLKPKVEEVYIKDTIIVLKPVKIATRVVDTIYVPLRDTIAMHDTTYVALAREEKTYCDTNYRAVVSGYAPSLDEIEVYPTTKIVYKTTTEYKKKRFGLGVSLGYGATLNDNQVLLRPYLGLSLNYNLICF